VARECLEVINREEEGHALDAEIDTDGCEEADADSLEGNACVKLVGV